MAFTVEFFYPKCLGS